MVNITKVDGDRNLVFGWAYVSIDKDGDGVVDHSKESVDPGDLEDAAYVFNLAFRESGEQHRGSAKGELIESFVSTPDKLEALGLAKDALPVGWWVGFYIDNDDVFKKVKDGTYKMFSIQGRAIREPVAA